MGLICGFPERPGGRNLLLFFQCGSAGAERQGGDRASHNCCRSHELLAQKCVFVIGITCQMVAFGDDENVGGGIPSPKTTPASQTTTIDDSTWPWGGRGQALTAPRAFNSKRGRARS